MTAQHYASPSSVANSRSSRVADALTSDSAAERMNVISLLKNMSSKDLLALLDGLASMGIGSHCSDDNIPT